MNTTSVLSTSQPAAAAILVYWRLTRPDGQILACTSYRTADDLELLVGLEGDTPIWSARVEDHAAALELATMWKASFAGS